MVAPRTGFTPLDSPQVAVSDDGKLAAIQESDRVTILELPSGAPFAEVGIDPDAIASAIHWVSPGRLIVLSRYAAHSTVHLLDPDGPRSIAEIRLESPMRLVASVGATALAFGPLGAAVLAATDTHVTLYPFPTRSVPLAAGAAAAQIMVALPGSIEEWDPRTRMPTRRLRLPRVAGITAVGGSERVVWMTTQHAPARIDVIPLVNRGQPRAHEFPEPIAQIAAHPRSDVVACVGEASGRMYIVDLDGRLPMRVIAPEGIDRIEALAMVGARAANVLVAQAGRPVMLVSLSRRDGDGRSVADADAPRGPAVEHVSSSLGESAGRASSSFGELAGETPWLGGLAGEPSDLDEPTGATSSLGGLAGERSSLGELAGETSSLGELAGERSSLGEAGETPCIGELAGEMASLGEPVGERSSLGEPAGERSSLGELAGERSSLGERLGLSELAGEMTSLGEPGGRAASSLSGGPPEITPRTHADQKERPLPLVPVDAGARPPVRRLSLDGASLPGDAVSSERDTARADPPVREPSSLAALLKRSRAADASAVAPPSTQEPPEPRPLSTRLSPLSSLASARPASGAGPAAALFRRSPPPAAAPPVTEPPPAPTDTRPTSASERFSAWRDRARHSQLAPTTAAPIDELGPDTGRVIDAIEKRAPTPRQAAKDDVPLARAAADAGVVEAALNDARRDDPAEGRTGLDDRAGHGTDVGRVDDQARPVEEVGTVSASAEASGFSWRDDAVVWSRCGMDRQQVPAAPALDALRTRFELAPALQPVLVALYSAHLCGERGVAPIEIARLMERQWAEALGRGELARYGIAVYADSRVSLAPVVQRMLDELPPVTGTLVGEPGAVALLGPCVVVAGAAPLAVLAARCVEHVGGAILAARDDVDRAAVVLEARVYGAAPMLRTTSVDPSSSEPLIAVVADSEIAERLAVPRLL